MRLPVADTLAVLVPEVVEVAEAVLRDVAELETEGVPVFEGRGLRDGCIDALLDLEAAAVRVCVAVALEVRLARADVVEDFEADALFENPAVIVAVRVGRIHSPARLRCCT